MNLKRYLPKEKETFLLILILTAAFILRYWNLTFQSYWLDELHTMNEADPDQSWEALFNALKCCDQHPPLHFIISRICFTVFGHTEFVGRFISVVFGTAGVWAMWLLGKEILDKRLGLIAATLACFNYFLIAYSQEARNYIVVFFFSALSLAYLIRVLKYFNKRDVILYALFTLLMMYSHYYGLFVVVAEFFIAGFLLLFGRFDKKQFFRSFLLAGVIIALGYLPWVPFLLQMTKIESFWISPIDPGFAKEYFSQYFGDSALILPFIILLLVYYCIEVFKTDRQAIPASDKNPYNPLTLSFIVLFSITILTYLIPYLRSVLVVPMLFNRYTIVVVPAFLIAIAFALVRIHNSLVRSLLLGTLVILSFIDLTAVKKYYTLRRKTQFREITSFMASAMDKNYPIINEVTNWQHQYYIKRFQYTGPVWAGKKEDLVDSILKKSNPKYNIDGFWIAGFHGDQKLNATKRAALDTAFILIKDSSGVDSWAEFYLSKEASNGSSLINAFNFPPQQVADIDGEKVISIWGGSVNSHSIKLKKGSYEMTIISRGTPVAEEYPHLQLFFNEQLVHDMYTPAAYAPVKKLIHIPVDGDYELKITMENDASNAAKSEDRNAFVKRIILLKQ